MKTGVLILNLGTPDSTKTSDVRTYLSEFLNDPRVIDIPWLFRKILVNLIIVPFRAPKSANEYKKVWTKDGSPLLLNSISLRDKLRTKFGKDADIELAMRYQHPSMEEVLEKMKVKNYDQLIVFPLYPQYASSSTGSTIEEAMRIISKWWVIPQLKFLGQFYNHPGYINTIVQNAKKYDIASYDHILFSYHGLPVRQIDKVYENGLCSDRNCEDEVTEESKFCYKAVCYETSRLIAKEVGIEKSKYTVGFQSRLDKDWIKPFSDHVVEELAQKGAKKILVFSPAFVSDCLETTVEIGGEYLEIFREHGGEQLDLVESLNDNDLWVNTLENIIKKEI